MFRYVIGETSLSADEINTRIRRKLFDRGHAVIGRTRVNGEQCLKLTLVNPLLHEEQLAKLVGEIEPCGEEIEEESTRLRAKASIAE